MQNNREKESSQTKTPWPSSIDDQGLCRGTLCSYPRYRHHISYLQPAYSTIDASSAIKVPGYFKIFKFIFHGLPAGYWGSKLERLCRSYSEERRRRAHGLLSHRATRFPPRVLQTGGGAGGNAMRMSRKIWGGFVFSLGLLWLLGGIFGYLQDPAKALLYVFCGMVLTRFGYNLMRPQPPA